MKLLKLYWTFGRPFTLIPPMIGIFSGSLIGYGATHVHLVPYHVVLAVLASARGSLLRRCNRHSSRRHKPQPFPLKPRADAFTVI